MLQQVVEQLKLQKEENNQFRSILVQQFTGPKTRELHEGQQIAFEQTCGDFQAAITTQNSFIETAMDRLREGVVAFKFSRHHKDFVEELAEESPGAY